MTANFSNCARDRKSSLLRNPRTSQTRSSCSCAKGDAQRTRDSSHFHRESFSWYFILLNSFLLISLVFRKSEWENMAGKKKEASLQVWTQRNLRRELEVCLCDVTDCLNIHTCAFLSCPGICHKSRAVGGDARD